MVTEILSRDDSMVDVEEKAAEYAAWGVKNIWLVNPWLGDTGLGKRSVHFSFKARASRVRLELHDR